MPAGRHGNGAGTERTGADHVVGSVTNDPGVRRCKVHPVMGAGPAQREGPEQVAILAVVREGPEGEVAPEVFAGQFGLRAPAEVAGEQAQGNPAGEGALKQGGHARQGADPAVGHGRR